MLALIQETELEQRRKKSSQAMTKSSFRPFPLSEKQKPVTVDKPDKVGMVKQQLDRPESDDKVKALMLFRKKNGMCFKCGEK